MSTLHGVIHARPGNLQGTTNSQPAPQAPHTDAANLQAPVLLTLPEPSPGNVAPADTPRVRAALAEPARPGAAPTRADVARRNLMEAGDKLQEARQAGVDVAKSTFWKKALGAAVSGVALGVAIGLTAISLGGAAPVLALACVNFAVSSGDAVCAYRNLRNTEATAQLRAPPYPPLPMGNSIVGNVLHGTLTTMGMRAETATTVAKWGGRVTTVGLGIATVAVGVGLAQAPQAFALAGKIAAYLGTAVNVFSTVFDGIQDRADREALQECVHDIQNDLAARLNVAPELNEMDAETQMQARSILSALGGSANPVAIHDQAVDDGGRTGQGVRAALGMGQAVSEATGFMRVAAPVAGAVLGMSFA